jgi:hypothetical protein
MMAAGFMVFDEPVDRGRHEFRAVRLGLRPPARSGAATDSSDAAGFDMWPAAVVRMEK